MPDTPDIAAAPGSRQARVADAIRQSIVSGDWLPGHRLPTQTELIRIHGVSGVTVQRAIAALAHDGFIETRGRRGTFVVERPPHLWKYALVIPQVQADRPTRFAQAIVAEAQRLGPGSALRFDTYYATPHADDRRHRELIEDIDRRRLAGAVILDAYEFAGSPLLDDNRLPRVALIPAPWIKGVPSVYPDMSGLMRLAIDELAAAGLRSAAAIITPAMHDVGGLILRQAAADRGVALPERWIQITSHTPPAAARNAVLLLLDAARDARPEALVVLDDNLIDAALAGLLGAGLPPGETPRLYAHVNFPAPPPANPQVRRLGFDVRRVLRTCLDMLDAQRLGRTPPAMTLVPAEREPVEPGDR